jgi:phosphoribosylanthranilate isomerase
MKVKVCGTRSYEDARAALDAGAWAVGFVFHPPSRRFIEPEEAARIARRLPADALKIGVFVDAPLDAVNATVKIAGLGGVQLHGTEDEAYAASVEADVVIKAFRVGPWFDAAKLRGYPGCRALLDAYRPDLPGGTGASFDWAVARRAGEVRPILLAGGLTPENVGDALIAARPDGLDVSTGLESAPGVKDHGKIARFFEAVGRACGESRT